MNLTKIVLERAGEHLQIDIKSVNEIVVEDKYKGSRKLYFLLHLLIIDSEIPQYSYGPVDRDNLIRFFAASRELEATHNVKVTINTDFKPPHLEDRVY